MLVPRRIQKVKSSNDWYERCILKCNPLLSINAMNKTYWHPRLWQEMCMLEMHNRSLSRYFCHSFLVYAVCLKASAQISFSRQRCCRRQLVWVCRRQFEVMVPLNSKYSWFIYEGVHWHYSIVFCSLLQYLNAVFASVRWKQMEYFADDVFNKFESIKGLLLHLTNVWMWRLELKVFALFAVQKSIIWCSLNIFWNRVENVKLELKIDDWRWSK